MFKDHPTLSHDMFERPRQLDPDYIYLLQVIDSELRAIRPNYVAITPLGSRFKGYSLCNSDYDVGIIASDDSETDRNALISEIKEIGARLSRHVGICILAPPSTVMQFLAGGNDMFFFAAAHFLAFPLIGRDEWLETYRGLIADKFAEVSTSVGHVDLCLHTAAANAVCKETGVMVMPRVGGGEQFRTVVPDTIHKIVSRGYARHGIEPLARHRLGYWKRTLRDLFQRR